MGQPSSRRTDLRAIALGTLLVGTLDICHAILFWGYTRSTPPLRILQSVAAGVLGRDAFRGGLPSALLGLALHLFIAGFIVTTFYLVSRRWRGLTRHPVPYGLAYGVGVYFFMNQVVLPLSRALTPPFSRAWMLHGIFGHAFFVGLPSALVARWASVPPQQGRIAA